MYATTVLGLLVVVTAAGQKYTAKYDNVDLQSILNNDRLLNNYFNCIMDKGKCTPDGEELKKNIPDALENECAKCNEKQKAGAKEALRFLYEKKQEMFKHLEAKYDPDGKYRAKYRERAQDVGVPGCRGLSIQE